MIANLHITTVLKNGSTRIGENYFTPPFKIANITEDKQAKELHLVLMSSSPGILGGDEYALKIELGEESSLRLDTQAYQRLFTMKKGAKQLMELHLQKGASVVYLPHPVVPHENSIFKATNKIYLSNNCRLIWGEILTCGRKLNDEVFQCSSYHNLTEVFINNKLVIKENLLIKPSLIDPGVIGQLEGFTHQASFIYLDEKADCTEMSAIIQEYLLLQKDMAFGITAAPVPGLLIRLLGYKAEQLHNCLKAISEIINVATNRKKNLVIHAN